MGILTRRNIPNFITGFRLLIVIPVFITIINEHYGYALSLFVIAGVSDGVDGFLARRYDWTSQFGTIADPIADKLLMLVSFLGLAWLGHIPIWLVAIVIFRDVWLIAGAAAYKLKFKQAPFAATRISKLNTVIQLFYIVLILTNLAVYPMPIILIEATTYLVLITTVSSFIDYTLVWGLKTREQFKAKANE